MLRYEIFIHRLLLVSHLFLITFVMCFLLITSVQAANKNVAVAKFKGMITTGTCSVSLNSKKNTLDLKSVSSSSIFLDRPLLSSDSEPQLLDVLCLGYPESLSKPSLTVYGNDIANTSSSLFRDGGDNPSSSLGFKVQAAKIGSIPSDWETIEYLKRGEPFFVDTSPGNNVNGAKIPVRFSMWCVPQAGKTISDCRSGGKVIANVSFIFDYQ